MTCLGFEKKQKFSQNISGSSTVEFVIALPILLAMLAFAVQYGNALKIRNNLDVASRDAARYLARSSLDTTGVDVDQVFKDKARQIISDRIENTKSTITAFVPTSNASSVTVDVTIDVPFPLLRWIGLFDSADASLSMSATESWSRTGNAVITTGIAGGGS